MRVETGGSSRGQKRVDLGAISEMVFGVRGWEKPRMVPGWGGT